MGAGCRHVTLVWPAGPLYSSAVFAALLLAWVASRQRVCEASQAKRDKACMPAKWVPVRLVLAYSCISRERRAPPGLPSLPRAS